MTGQTIRCGCGYSFRAPDESFVSLRCPKCGKSLVYLDPTAQERQQGSGDVHWGEATRHKPARRKRKKKKKHQTSGAGRFFVETGSFISQQFTLNPARMWVGLLIAVLAFALVFYAVQIQVLLEKSEAQLDFELAERLEADGNYEQARQLYEQIIEQTAPHSVWAQKSKHKLAQQ